MDKAPFDKMKYAGAAGKHASNAARFFRQGDAKRAKKHADMAVQEQDLMHPDLWHQWSYCPPEGFPQALEHFSAAEAAKLAAARDHHGWDVVWSLAAVPGALGALRAAGLDLEAPRGLLAKVPVRACALLAFQGASDGLIGMMRAGMDPPGPLERPEADAMGKAGFKTLAHALAASPRSAGQAPPELAELVGWLARGARLGSRDALGRDELKIAIESGNCALAAALIDGGCDPNQVDAKGRDALATLDRRVKAMAAQSNAMGAQPLVELRSKLLAKAEEREMDGSAAWAAEPSKPKARSL